MKKLVEVKKLQRIRALRKLRFHSKRIVEIKGRHRAVHGLFKISLVGHGLDYGRKSLVCSFIVILLFYVFCSTIFLLEDSILQAAQNMMEHLPNLPFSFDVIFL